MQPEVVSVLDGDDYKEYEVLIDAKPLGVISWNGEREDSEGRWYTTASDGHPRYFQTQAEVIEFLKNDPMKSANELSAKLKAEANKLLVIAEEIENNNAPLES